MKKKKANDRLEKLNGEFINLIDIIRNTPVKKNRIKLLKQARELHLTLLEEFNNQEIPNRLNLAINHQSLLVKAISADLKESKQKHLEFFFRQIIFPETNRPVKTDRKLENGYTVVDRTRIFNTVTGEYEQRTINPIRGENQDSPFAKRTPFTITLMPALTHTFNYDFSVLLLGDLRYFYLKNTHIFDVNKATNRGWHIKGNKGWEEVKKNPNKHKAAKLSAIRERQLLNISQKKMSTQNELVCRPSFAGCFGFSAVAKKAIDKEKNLYEYVAPARADRLNALYVNYVFRQVVFEREEYKKLTYILQNFPCYILSPNADELKNYTIFNQLEDLESALDEKQNTYSKKIAQNLRRDVKTLEIYSPAIKLFFLTREYQQEQKYLLNETLSPDVILAGFLDGFPWKKLLPEQIKVLCESKVSDNFINEVIDNDNFEIIDYIAENETISLNDEQWNHPEIWMHALQTQNRKLMRLLLNKFPNRITNGLAKNSKPILQCIALDEKIILSKKQWQHPQLWQFAQKYQDQSLILRILERFPDKITEALEKNTAAVMQVIARDEKIMLSSEQWRHPNLLQFAIKQDYKKLIFSILDKYPEKITIFLEKNDTFILKLLFEVNHFPKIKNRLTPQQITHPHVWDFALKNVDEKLIYHILTKKLPDSRKDLLKTIAFILSGKNELKNVNNTQPSRFEVLNLIYSQELYGINKNYISNYYCAGKDSKEFMSEFIPDNRIPGLFALSLKNCDTDSLLKAFSRLSRVLPKEKIGFIISGVANSDIKPAEKKQLIQAAMAIRLDGSQDQTLLEMALDEMIGQMYSFQHILEQIIFLSGYYCDDSRRRACAHMIKHIINKAQIIDTLMTIVNLLETPENSARWAFIRDRRSLLRKNNYDYTWEGKPVSVTWIGIMRFAQHKVIQLAETSTNLSKDSAVITFLKKPTWETGFFNTLFSAPPDYVTLYENIYSSKNYSLNNEENNSTDDYVFI